MGKLYLKGNREIDLTPEQDIALVRYLMIMPAYKKMKIAGVVFSIEDLDLERERKENAPQQTLFKEKA